MPTPTELAAAMLGGLADLCPSEDYSYGHQMESRLDGEGRAADAYVIYVVERETGRCVEACVTFSESRRRVRR